MLVLSCAATYELLSGYCADSITFRCFEILARELALPPAAILYVGDDPARDVMAARGAGLATAWMNRRNAAWPGSFAPADLTVRDCHELADALEARDSAQARCAADRAR